MKYDFCILGAGLAGLSLAKELNSISNASVLIVDPLGVGGGASGSPIGLANPATGRFATKSWRSEESLQILRQNLETVSSFSEKTFYSMNGVIRPAMDSRIAQRMKENLEASDWPEGWCSWLTENEIIKNFPGLYCKEGGIWVSSGITISIPEYLKALSKYLKVNGVDIIENCSLDLQKHPSSWILDLQSKNKIEAKHIVVTAGIRTNQYDFWESLPLHPVKGQVAVFKAELSFPFKAAVSALGYFASVDNNTFVAGSTYEHNFTHEDTDQNGLTYIEDRMLRVIPDLKGKYKLIKQWAGVRASTPDRKPIVGTHPVIDSCSVFTGLGSKGLLYSSILAKELSEFLINDSLISPEVFLNRF